MRKLYLNVIASMLLLSGFTQNVSALEPRTRGNLQAAAVLGTPLVAAAAIGAYWYFWRESDTQKIDKAYALMASLSVYERAFVTTTGRGDVELVLSDCLAHFGVTVDELTEDFLDVMNVEVQALKDLRNNLWWRSLRIKSWYVDPEVALCEHKLYTYWCHAYEVLKFFNKHRKFVQGYHVRNFYRQIPSDRSNLKNWVLGAMSENAYPMQAYVEMAKADLAWIKRFHLESQTMALYPVMVRSVVELTQNIENSIMQVVALEEYQAEVIARQKHLEQIAFMEIERAKAEAARERADAAHYDAIARREQAEAAHLRAAAAFQANDIEKERISRGR